MPLYEYQCDSCGHRFERIQKFSDPPIAECPNCGAPVRKLLSSPAIQFKGSGWYITDYAKSGSSERPSKSSKGDDTAKSAEGASSTESSAKSEASKSESSSTTDTAAKPASPPAKKE